MNLHPDDVAAFEKAKTLAFVVAKRLSLPLRVFEPKRRIIHGTFGLCYRAEGRICVTFRWKNAAQDGGEWWCIPIAWDAVVDTICHELAHLEEDGHGFKFREAERKIREAFLEAEREDGDNDEV